LFIECGCLFGREVKIFLVFLIIALLIISKLNVGIVEIVRGFSSFYFCRLANDSTLKLFSMQLQKKKKKNL